jgi:hypothetical protein
MAHGGVTLYPVVEILYVDLMYPTPYVTPSTNFGYSTTLTLVCTKAQTTFGGILAQPTDKSTVISCVLAAGFTVSGDAEVTDLTGALHASPRPCSRVISTQLSTQYYRYMLG